MKSAISANELCQWHILSGARLSGGSVLPYFITSAWSVVHTNAVKASYVLQIDSSSRAFQKQLEHCTANCSTPCSLLALFHCLFPEPKYTQLLMEDSLAILGANKDLENGKESSLISVTDRQLASSRTSSLTCWSGYCTSNPIARLAKSHTNS